MGEKLIFSALSRSYKGTPLFDYWLLNTVIAVSFSPVVAAGTVAVALWPGTAARFDPVDNPLSIEVAV